MREGWQGSMGRNRQINRAKTHLCRRTEEGGKKKERDLRKKSARRKEHSSIERKNQQTKTEAALTHTTLMEMRKGEDETLCLSLSAGLACARGKLSLPRERTKESVSRSMLDSRKVTLPIPGVTLSLSDKKWRQWSSREKCALRAALEKEKHEPAARNPVFLNRGNGREGGRNAEKRTIKKKAEC